MRRSLHHILSAATAFILFCMPMQQSVFAGTLSSFTYLVTGVDLSLASQQQLKKNISYIFAKADPIYISDLFFMQTDMRTYFTDFVEMQRSYSSGSQDISLFRDVESFLEIDIWADLEKSTNRTQTTNEYIALGEMMLQSSQSQYTRYTERANGLKSSVAERKKVVKALEKEYSSALSLWDAQRIEVLADEIETEENLIVQETLEYEKLIAYSKRLSSFSTDIENKVQGAKENKQALIKNVKVQGDSGKYIDAIE